MNVRGRWYTLLLLLAALAPVPAGAASVEVVVEGVRGDLRDNVLLFLGIEQQKQAPLLTEARIRRLHQKAAGEIETALQPFGYYRPAVNSKLTLREDGVWEAGYVIDPGPPLRIRKLDVTLGGDATDDPAFQALLTGSPLRAGARLDQRDYEDLKNSLVKLASEHGYFDARLIEHAIHLDLPANAADVVLNFDSGQRYRFGTVHFRQDALDPELLSRYTPFRRGDAYSISTLIDLQQALNDSDYFNNVEVQPQSPDPAALEVPVEVELTPRPRHKYTLGAGYGTDTGARGKVGWENTRVNRRGHRLDAEYRITEIGDSLTSRYRIPAKNPRTDEYILSAGLSSEHTDTSESRTRTLGASVVHGRGQWREVISISYQEERFTVGLDEGRSSLLMPGINWSRVWARDRIDVRQGARLIIDLKAASDQALSNSSFAQGRVQAKAILPAFSRGRLIGRGSLGGTLTPEFGDLPASVRFFAGGSQSVRGYAYNSLGPTDANGNVTGGKQLMTASLEYEHPFWRNWSAAVFYDIGDAVDAYTKALKEGAGAGLRWKSPVGPVRIDFASALSKPGQPWRLHLDIGPDL